MGDSTAKTGTTTSQNPAKESLDAYLLLYNTACAVGWNLTLYKIGTALLEGEGVLGAVNATHDLVVALQLLSTLELVHAFVGLVRWVTINVAKWARYRGSFFSFSPCRVADFNSYSSSFLQPCMNRPERDTCTPYRRWRLGSSPLSPMLLRLLLYTKHAAYRLMSPPLGMYVVASL